MATKLYVGKSLKEGAKVLLKAADLTTHGLCFGMTGSGKTGLCLTMLEELARQNIPIIAIDPKGDLANLALSWPDFDPGHYAEWIDQGRIRTSGKDAETLGNEDAAQWKAGLAGDDLTEEHVGRFRHNSDIQVYTPGSTAGVSVSVLDQFSPPKGFDRLPGEARSDLVQASVDAVLSLVGIDADPIKSREAILLSNILTQAWESGEAIDLSELILRIIRPPFKKLGVFPVDVFFPEKDRYKLAMRLNGLVASPTFAHWLKGEPIDIDALVEAKGDRTRCSIFSIAHLDDKERMAFVTLLLEKIVAWMRSQSGSGRLRALLFFDEIFGYMPPYPKNPPSKRPLLTLLKQARAFGLGVVLATQNPVDVDYKAITNAGVWMIGKLQTDQDKQRIIDGLVSAASEQGETIQRPELNRLISGLKTREFVMQNLHAQGLKIFRSRFAMSYLRGPLTRQELKTLREADFYNPPPPVVEEPVIEQAVEHERAEPETVEVEINVEPNPIVKPRPSQMPLVRAKKPPVKSRGVHVIESREEEDTPAGMEARFLQGEALRNPVIQGILGFSSLPEAGPSPWQYRPALWVKATTRTKLADHEHEFGLQRLVFPIPGASHQVDWEVESPIIPDDLVKRFGIKGVKYEACPAWLWDKQRVNILRKSVERALDENDRLSVPYCSVLDVWGYISETLEAFRLRLGHSLQPSAQHRVDQKQYEYEIQKSSYDNRLADIRNMLEMDKRELTQLDGRNLEQHEQQRIKDGIRTRMAEYKTLQKERDDIIGRSASEKANIEFRLMDELSSCRMETLPPKRSRTKIDYFGVLWIPSR